MVGNSRRCADGNHRASEACAGGGSASTVILKSLEVEPQRPLGLGLKAAMNFLPIVDHDDVTPLLALLAARVSEDLLFRAKHLFGQVAL